MNMEELKIFVIEEMREKIREQGRLHDPLLEIQMQTKINMLHDICSFLDAEIARQSVTDEAVQMAIEFQQEEIYNAKFSWSCLDEESKCEPGTEEMHVDYLYAHELAITALRQMHGWVSVDERLPRKEDYFETKNPTEFFLPVLINGYSENREVDLIETRLFDEIADSFKYRGITHWMSLPEPPKGEQP